METEGARVNGRREAQQAAVDASFAARLAPERPLEERRAAAADLENMGMRTRSSLVKRGSTVLPASSRSTDLLHALRRGVADSDADVRLKSVRAAGDLGDETLIADLRAILAGDSEPIRVAAVNAIGDIGGPSALQSLANVLVAESSEEVRFAALAELDELIAEPITSGPDRRFDPSHPVMPPSLEPVLDVTADDLAHVRSQLIEQLRRLALDERESGLMKLKADDLLRYLTE
jgi:hypothetical protein